MEGEVVDVESGKGERVQVEEGRRAQVDDHVPLGHEHHLENNKTMTFT